MDLLGPLIRCLYFSNAPVVGSMKNLPDDVSADLLLVLQHVLTLDLLLLLSLLYCNGVLLPEGYTCFLQSGHGGIASLVPFFWCILPFLLLMVELPRLDLKVSALCSYINLLEPPLEVNPYDLPPL